MFKIQNKENAAAPLFEEANLVNKKKLPLPQSQYTFCLDNDFVLGWCSLDYKPTVYDPFTCFV